VSRSQAELAVSSSRRRGRRRRRYSTTFTRLRQARHEHQLRRAHSGERRDAWGRPTSDGACVEQRRWAFTGVGYRTLGDAWLAETAAARARERRRVAREELRNSEPTPDRGRKFIVDAGGAS
jgi:uncharacterized membrane protein